MSKVPVKIGIIGGSGLDDPDLLENRVEKFMTTPFGSPSDALIEGKIRGVDCVLLARHGRKHNINPTNVNYRANVWAMKMLGCTHLVVTSATGSLREEVKRGDIVILDGFIDRTTKRETTFYDGKEGHPERVCHVPMHPAFCERTRQVLIETAKALGVSVHERGTVVTIEGPRFSSRAESEMFRSWGGTLVGMTQVPEVCLAKEAGLLYATVAMVTDYDCWKDSECVSTGEVLKTFQENVWKVKNLLIDAVAKIAEQDWTETVQAARELVKSNMM
ncbi:S-methyl-5'-thioadenosine phosphorylase [Phlebotomus papatasi]|uniref:S-methyl-5'-thioadenosine phosphorylase n=1 Tax=Phlebotomus papatasi TaxID=29031 RepID=UPI0024842379|nr:S-methyl-5'-thioadenosine phosphorylase [Phlebotomus papatasi]